MTAAHQAAGLVASVVDVGSNSVLLLTVEVAPDGRARQRDAALETTRLGSGLVDGGALDPAACARTRDAVVAMAARARQHGASRLWAFATGAARRARNGAAFASALARDAGCAVVVLSGDEEAALAYAAVAHGCAHDDRALLAVDAGGATTEITLGHGAAISCATSLPLGALALTERGGDADAEIAAALAGTPVLRRAREAEATVVASGGTATALAALDLGLRTYDPARVHGHTLAVAHLADVARRAPADVSGVLDPGRARILPAGASILAHVARAAGASVLRVSDHGVRHAYLRRRLASAGVDADLRALWS